MIVYGCRVSDPSRYVRFAGLGIQRVAHPEDLSAIADDERPLAGTYAQIVAAMRDRPDCEALVLVEEDVEITDPGFAARVMRRLREDGTELVTTADGGVIVLSPWALEHVDFATDPDASAAALATRAAEAVRRAGRAAGVEDLPVVRAGGAPAAGAPRGAGDGCALCGEPLPIPTGGIEPAVVTCRGCGVGVTLPPPSRDIESEGIWEEQYGGGRMLARPQWFKEGALRLNWVQAHRAAGTLVDVGCGTGELVAVAADRGFRAFGVEPTTSGREETARLPGVAGCLGDVADWPADDPVDVVTLMHVLEHVHEPHGFLGAIRSMLAPDGLLFIEVPHFGSAFAKRDPVAWTGSALSDHVLHYTEASIARLLGDCGFRVLESTPLPTMVYDDPEFFSARCRRWLAEGYLAPPEDLLRVLAAPVGAG